MMKMNLIMSQLESLMMKSHEEADDEDCDDEWSVGGV